MCFGWIVTISPGLELFLHATMIVSCANMIERPKAISLDSNTVLVDNEGALMRESRPERRTDVGGQRANYIENDGQSTATTAIVSPLYQEDN